MINESFNKLKERIIDFLTYDEEKLNEPYLGRGYTQFTRAQLAKEVENETEAGTECINNIILLTINLISRGKMVPTGEDLAALLSGIHQHHPATDDLIYFESDLLPVLKAFNLPDPIWGSNITLDEWKKRRSNG